MSHLWWMEDMHYWVKSRGRGLDRNLEGALGGRWVVSGLGKWLTKILLVSGDLDNFRKTEGV